MNYQVENKSRLGVNAFESFVIGELDWIFREQPVQDIGIDAQIEQVINKVSTGKFIAVQIKTGLGNVHQNSNGDFAYYMSKTHYDYWLSYSIPIIIVLYDPSNKKLYWEFIQKRNISKTKQGIKRKITIKKDSILTKESLEKLENIINIYQAKSFLPAYIKDMDEDEASEYATNLMEYCSDSIKKSVDIILDLDKVYKREIKKMELYVSNNFHNNQKDKDKLLKSVEISFIGALNLCRMRLKSEYPITIKSHIEAMEYATRFLINKDDFEFSEIGINIKKIFQEDFLAIESLGRTLEMGSKILEAKDNTANVKRAAENLASVLKDYKAELEDLKELINNFINKMTL